MDSSTGSMPLPPLYPNYSFPISNNLLRGTGQLTWLSPKAGLITCSKPSPVTVSFQLKDFCDAGVSDLTSILRVGFRLAFHASSPNDNNEWIANYVSPISDTDLNSGVFNDAKEMDLEAIERTLAPGLRQSHKDPYSLEKEEESLCFLLSIFEKASIHYIPLSSLHSRISNSGKDELYRYIGSSSLKRRQFIERRSYIFSIAENDVVFLQPSETYVAVCILTGFLLSHGGVTSSDALFNFFNATPLMPQTVKESIKNSRVNFMTFLSHHPFAFAPFPSQFYISVRRNLPYFDYTEFIKKNFPGCVYPRMNSIPSFSAPRPSPFGGFEHVHDVNMGSMPPFHTPTTPVTPLFQEDPLIASQKAARAVGVASAVTGVSGWPKDIGFFDHQSAVNSMAPGVLTSSVMGGASVPPSRMPIGVGPAKIPIVGGGSQPIVGRSANNMASVFNTDVNIPKIDFSKVDVTRRPTELNLRNSHSPILRPAKLFVDRFTQTDFPMNYVNVPRVDRAVGSDSTCCCKCTCQNQTQQQPDNHRRQSSTESLIMPRTQSELYNHFGEGEGDNFAALMRQRPVSVQEQPFGLVPQQQQRPLFGAPNGFMTAFAAKTTSAASVTMSGMTAGGGNGGMDSMGMNSVYATAGRNEFESLHDSFFNHTLHSFANNFLANGGAAMMNGGGFLADLDFSKMGLPDTFSTLGNNSLGVVSDAISAGQQMRSAQEILQTTALPMPIGVPNHVGTGNSRSSVDSGCTMQQNGGTTTSAGLTATNSSASSSNSIAGGDSVAVSSANSSSAETAGGTTTATSSSTSHYDPFGNGLPFKLELPAFSSLRL